MVDHQVDRHERVDTSGVLAGALHGGPHRRQVHHRRDTGEVLHEDARGQERQLRVGGRQRGPVGQHADVRFVGDPCLGEPDESFEQDLDGHRQARRVFDAGLGQVVERIKLEVASAESGPLDH